VSTKRIDAHMQRLADMGTRLRALQDADSATIQAELTAMQDMDLSSATWEEFTEHAEEARRLFLIRGHQLLRAKRREVTA
jgi:hypothetical protein